MPRADGARPSAALPHTSPGSPTSARPSWTACSSSPRRLKSEPGRYDGALRGRTRSPASSRSRRRARASRSRRPSARLGATPIALSPQELQLGRGESIADTARSLSGYVRGDRDPHVRAGDGRRARRAGRPSRSSTRSPTSTTRARRWPTCSRSRRRSAASPAAGSRSSATAATTSPTRCSRPARSPGST